MFSDLELMELHASVLFRHDAETRMTVVNEPPYEIAPQIFIGCTRQGNVVRYLNTLNASLTERFERVIGQEPGVSLGEIINVFSTNRQINHLWIGPAFVFPDVRTSFFTRAIQVTHQNKALLKTHFPYTFEDFEYKKPCFVIMEKDIPVSLCCSARRTSRAAEASVFTHKAHRGRGYGIEVLTAWAADIQRQGRVALYSTSWDNFASQALARKLRLVQYGTDIHMS